MADKILIVDDEKEIADLVALYLENENFTVYKYYTAKDALKCIQEETLDLAILDVMLPDTSGFQICRKIREKYRYPVIMLTAKGEEIDKITGLTLGADDYITKPFLPLELVARVKAQLRRYKRYNMGTEPEEDVIIHSGLVLNVKTHECILNEKPLSLTPTEFSILCILCREKGNVVSAEDLFHQIWGDEYYSKSNNTITVHIRHLREKMGDSFEDPKYIKTVWGCGYKIER
ncbi:MAG: VanR-ABDEGLN family response regulator transcription factor [Dorea sp.]|nr:VanR-ABDEGLN family response regulator transcription factor [Dorea sp.]